MPNDNAARIAAAEQANAALTNFLSPAFDAVKADYLAKLATIAAKPMTNDNRAGMEKLAIAIKVVNEVQTQIEQVVLAGDIAKTATDHAKQIADLPTEKAAACAILTMETNDAYERLLRAQADTSLETVQHREALKRSQEREAERRSMRRKMPKIY